MQVKPKGLKHKNLVLSNVRVTPDERLVLETSNLSVNLTHALWGGDTKKKFIFAVATL